MQEDQIKNKSQNFIPALTGIRGVSVYFIFFYHNNIFSVSDSPRSFNFVNQFYTFVTFLFVLSGFVICHKYYSISSLNKKDLYNYFVNRFSRIFPILFILTTATFLLQYLYHLDTPSHIIKTWFYNVTLLKGFSSEYYLTGIAPSWSLTPDWFFYTVCPFIFFYMAKPSSLIKVILLFYILGILITFMFSSFNIKGFFSSYAFTFFVTFFGRVFEFACGIYLAMVVNGKFKKRLLEKIGKFSLFYGLFIIFLALTGLYLITQIYNVPNGSDVWQGIVINNIVMPIGITILFYSLIFHKSHLQIFLSTGIMIALGDATYSFYLLHTSFILNWITKFLGRNIFISFFAMLIFSYCFYKVVEQPLSKFFRKKLHTK